MTLGRLPKGGGGGAGGILVDVGGLTEDSIDLTEAGSDRVH